MDVKKKILVTTPGNKRKNLQLVTLPRSNVQWAWVKLAVVIHTNQGHRNHLLMNVKDCMFCDTRAESFLLVSVGEDVKW